MTSIVFDVEVMPPRWDWMAPLFVRCPVVIYDCCLLVVSGVIEVTLCFFGLRYISKKASSVASGFTFGILYGAMDGIWVVGFPAIMLYLSRVLNALGIVKPIDVMVRLANEINLDGPRYHAVWSDCIVVIVLLTSVSVLLWVALVCTERKWLVPLAFIFYVLARFPASASIFPTFSPWLKVGVSAAITACIAAYAFIWWKRCLAEQNTNGTTNLHAVASQPEREDRKQ